MSEEKPKKLDGLCRGCKVAIDVATLAKGLVIKCERCGRKWKWVQYNDE
jgi:uncharacterized paraquat-inducible protein A